MTQRTLPWHFAGWLTCAAIVLLALAMRLIGWEDVFLGGDDVIFRIGDSHSHARRAAVTFLDFPRVLAFDTYINYPHGAAIPSPPLYDVAVASLAALTGSGIPHFERVQALASPFFGALAALVVVLTARRLAGWWAALGAGALYAVFPVIGLASGVGDADHHAAISFVGACWLAASLALPGSHGRRLVALATVFAVCRLAMFLTWGGSISYAAVADGTLLLTAVMLGRRDLLVAQAVGAALGAAVLIPIVVVLPVPAWGPWSAGALSWLHPLASLAVATVAGTLAILEWRSPATSAPQRIGRLLSVSIAFGGLLLSLPGPRNGLLGGLGFVGSSGVGQNSAIAELLALYPGLGRPAIANPMTVLGGFVYLVPVAPLFAFLLGIDPARRTRALILAAWTSVFALLFVLQYRFGTEFAAPGSIAFAAGLGEIGRQISSRAKVSRAWGSAAAGLVGIALMIPAAPVWLPRAQTSLRALGRAPAPAEARLWASPAGALTAFMRKVRAVTPETEGWLGGTAPAYGILCSPNLGHSVQYVARRASPASGYMHLAGLETLEASKAFMQSRSQRKALGIARDLGAAYVITTTFPGMVKGSVERRLHFHDGSAGDRGSGLGRFRLVTEAPSRGRPLTDLFAFGTGGARVPYKLFEIVKGALISVAAPPGSVMEAEIDLLSPAGRRFVWRTRIKANARGRAFVRVPYSSGDASVETSRTGNTTTQALGPWRVRRGDEDFFEVTVLPIDVEEGRTIAADPGYNAGPSS